MREQASGMRQLAGKKTRYPRADAAPLAGLISGRAEYKRPITSVSLGRSLEHCVKITHDPYCCDDRAQLFMLTETGRYDE